MGKEALTPQEVKTLKEICKLFKQTNRQKVNVNAFVKTKVAFTDRELLIIRLTCQEFKAGEIAEKMVLTERTVEKFKTEIFRKAGVHNSLGLLKYALKHGLYKT